MPQPLIFYNPAANATDEHIQSIELCVLLFLLHGAAFFAAVECFEVSQSIAILTGQRVHIITGKQKISLEYSRSYELRLSFRIQIVSLT